MAWLNPTGFLAQDGTTPLFFATGAQCAAGIAGLVAALAIFRYQGLLQVIEIQADEIIKGLDSYDWLLNEEEQKVYDRLTTNPERIAWWAARMRVLHGHTFLEDLKRRFDDKYHPLTMRLRQKVEHKILVFERWQLRIEHLERLVKRTGRFRRLVISQSIFGFTVVLLGVCGTFSPTLRWLGLDIAFYGKVLYGLILTVYLAATVYLIAVAFLDPRQIVARHKPSSRRA